MDYPVYAISTWKISIFCINPTKLFETGEKGVKLFSSHARIQINYKGN